MKILSSCLQKNETYTGLEKHEYEHMMIEVLFLCELSL